MSDTPAAAQTVSELPSESGSGSDSHRVDLPKPGPGESQSIAVDGVHVVGFTGIALADVVLRLNGDSIEFLFDNAGRIVLEDIRQGSDTSPGTLLLFGGGAQVEAQALVEVLVALTPPAGDSSPAVPIETAFGMIHGGGADFRTVDLGELTSGLDTTGVLANTDSGGLGGTSNANLFRDDEAGGRQAGNAAPIAEADLLTTDEDTGASINVVANDHDPDGTSLRLLGIDTDGLSGNFTYSEDGTIGFDPAGAFEYLGVGEQVTQTVTYRVADDAGATSEGSLKITIDGVNDRPDTTHDNIRTSEDTPITFTERWLSGDDFDAEGDWLDVIDVHHAENGTVVLNPDGTVTFTPEAGFTGQASFRYTVTDGNGGHSAELVTVHVSPINHAPSGGADAVLTNIVDGSPIAIPIGWLLENDSDVDGDALSLIDPTASGGAAASLDGAGNVVFTPDGGPFDGGSFSYSLVDDGTPAATSDPIDVSVTASAGRNLTGTGASEIMIGGDGNDFFRGKGGRDFLDGGDGDDRLNGGGGRDRLLGGEGDDKLNGGNGDDRLDGGDGDDRLSGGSGSDRFVVSDLGDTDTIVDFQSGADGDIIDLDSILTGLSGQAGSDLDGHLSFTFDGDDTVISIDADGGGDFGSPNATLVLSGIDLLSGSLDQAALIDQLIGDGNLSVD